MGEAAEVERREASEGVVWRESKWDTLARAHARESGPCE